MLIAQPGQMGPLKLRNRIIMGPMGTNYGTTDGLSTERDKLYYGERAKGGAAMIITEAMVITEGARNHTNSMCLFHDRYIPGLAGIVEAIHAHGALAVGRSITAARCSSARCWVWSRCRHPTGTIPTRASRRARWP